MTRIGTQEPRMAKDTSDSRICSESPRQTPGISRESSENDVLSWLKTEVGLDDNVIEKYDNLHELNGLTLFSYGGDDAPTVFASESRVPLRIAFRILCIRDRIHEKRSNPLLKFTSEQISEFVGKIYKKRDRTCVKMLCEHIIKWNIDGLIFYCYKDEKEFQRDFNDLDIDGLLFRKAILMRNDKFNIPTSTYPLLCDEKMKVRKALSKSITPETQSMDKECPDESVAVKFKKDLCSKLSLDEKRESDNYKPCKFNIIYSSWSLASNELEKNNLFFLIHEDEFTKSKEKNRLWREIISNKQQWLGPLSQDLKETCNGENVMHTSQCRFENVMNKTYDVNNFDHTFLFITKNVFESEQRCFVTNLSSNRGSSQQFYFAFQTLVTYIVFDPENYSNGFKRQKMEVQRTLSKKVKCAEPQEGSFQPLEITNTKNKSINIQYPRSFKKNPGWKYQFGSTFPQPESGGKLFTRCLEFKALFSHTKNGRDDRWKIFVKEVLRFSAACLNCRKDGTIFFGVADSKGCTDGKMYEHGEIVGIPGMDSNTRNFFTEELEKAIKNYGFFQSELVDTAFECISEPQFVEVEMPEETECRFVIEVDVQPSSLLCKTFYFKSNMIKIDKKERDENVLLVRNGASTYTLRNEEKRAFINLELPIYISLREKFEGELLEMPSICDNFKKGLKNILQYFFSSFEPKVVRLKLNTWTTCFLQMLSLLILLILLIQTFSAITDKNI